MYTFTEFIHIGTSVSTQPQTYVMTRLPPVIKVQGRAGGRTDTVAGYHQLVQQMGDVSVGVHHARGVVKGTRGHVDDMVDSIGVRDHLLTKHAWEKDRPVSTTFTHKESIDCRPL